MIERYSRKVMRDVWTEQNKFNAYLKVEILASEAWSELGVVPKEDVQKLCDELQDSIRWFDNKQSALEYFKNHDWEGDFFGLEEETVPSRSG